MKQIKTDEQILKEYLPKLKEFTEKRLNGENAGKIYKFLKRYNYDKDGWRLRDAAEKLLNVSIYNAFPAEDNLGYFEELDGFGIINWMEIAKFADIDYMQLQGGYEKMTGYTLNRKSQKYLDYRKALWPAAVQNIIDELIKKQPRLLPEFWNRLLFIQNKNK